MNRGPASESVLVPATAADLERFVQMVLKWSSKINLISASSASMIWKRHIADSLQLTDVVSKWSSWVDIGSGGGFPALPIAIASRDVDACGPMTLIESDTRKAAFLSSVVREFSLNVSVIPDRAEKVDPLAADVVSARAVASMPRLLPMVHRHLAPGGVGLLHKGRHADTELGEAHRNWSFDLTRHQSATDVSGTILEIRRLVHAA